MHNYVNNKWPKDCNLASGDKRARASVSTFRGSTAQARELCKVRRYLVFLCGTQVTEIIRGVKRYLLGPSIHARLTVLTCLREGRTTLLDNSTWGKKIDRWLAFLYLQPRCLGWTGFMTAMIYPRMESGGEWVSSPFEPPYPRSEVLTERPEKEVSPFNTYPKG